MQAASLGAIVMAFPPIVQSVLTLIGMLVIALLIDWQVTLVVAGGGAVHLLRDRPLRHPHRAAPPARAEPRVAVAVDRLRGDGDAARDRLLRPREATSTGASATQGKTAVDARVRLTVRQTLFSLGVTDRDRARHRARARLRRLARARGQDHARRAARPDRLHRRGLPAARADQHDDRLPAPAASCSSTRRLDCSTSSPRCRRRPDAVDIGRARGDVAFEDVSFAYKGRVRTRSRTSRSTCKRGAARRDRRARPAPARRR